MKVIHFDRNNCKRIRAFLDSYLNSELLVETAHEVLRHLADCRECAAILAECERLKARLQAAVRRDVASADLSQRIQKSIRQNRRREWSQWMIGIAALLAALLLLIGHSQFVLGAGSRDNAPPSDSRFLYLGEDAR